MIPNKFTVSEADKLCVAVVIVAIPEPVLKSKSVIANLVPAPLTTVPPLTYV